MRLVLIVCLLVTSCASREPASTDNHHVVQTTCGIIKYGGSMRTMCCVGEECWLKD